MMIQELFNNRKNVNAIPVIDNENKLLREYYRYNEDIESGKNRISFDIVKKIYHEAMLMPYDIVLFILDTLSEKEYTEAKDIFNKTNNKILILGHRYLIEEAKKQVDFLYIFVVEEDKSCFRFCDRFKMVKDGVSDLGGRLLYCQVVVILYQHRHCQAILIRIIYSIVIWMLQKIWNYSQV